MAILSTIVTILQLIVVTLDIIVTVCAVVTTASNIHGWKKKWKMN